jgi:hypothetical protein
MGKKVVLVAALAAFLLLFGYGGYLCGLNLQMAASLPGASTSSPHGGVATASPTATPTPPNCPIPTLEPFWVEPVLSPTGRNSQTIKVYLGNGEAVTVTCESGIFVQQGGPGAFQPALVDVDLLPDTLHNLSVVGKVRLIESDNGCVYGGYRLSTNRDRDGKLLAIAQRTDLPTIWLPNIPRSPDR